MSAIYLQVIPGHNHPYVMYCVLRCLHTTVHGFSSLEDFCILRGSGGVKYIKYVTKVKYRQQSCCY
jgi:hypothetical protein